MFDSKSKDLWMLILYIFMLLLNFVFVLQAVAFYTLIERHTLGLRQNRFGPKKVRFYGLLQPLLDGVKLLRKEQFFAFNITPSVFFGVTVFSFNLLYIE